MRYTVGLWFIFQGLFTHNVMSELGTAILDGLRLPTAHSSRWRSPYVTAENPDDGFSELIVMMFQIYLRLCFGIDVDRHCHVLHYSQFILCCYSVSCYNSFQ